MDIAEEEALPTYEDVLRETKAERERVFSYWCDVVFTVTDIILTAAFVVGFAIIRFTEAIDVHVINATKFCNDSTYNADPVPEANYDFLYGLMGFTFAMSTLAVLVKSIVEKRNLNKVLSAMGKHIWALGIHVLCLTILVDLLKLSSGIMRPYFFSSKDIRSLYCEGETIVSPSLKEIDRNLRLSFPSYRSAVYSFCLTFSYLFLDHLDIQTGIHATQQFFTIILMYLVSLRIYDFWLEGENHLNDIVGGMIIGIVQGAVTVRCMFGSIFGGEMSIHEEPAPTIDITSSVSIRECSQQSSPETVRLFDPTLVLEPESHALETDL